MKTDTMTQFTVDGINYLFVSLYEGDIIEVYETPNNTIIGQAEFDHGIEYVFIQYFNDVVGHLDDCDTSKHINQFKRDFPETVDFARWLVSSHPDLN